MIVWVSYIYGVALWVLEDAVNIFRVGHRSKNIIKGTVLHYAFWMVGCINKRVKSIAIIRSQHDDVFDSFLPSRGGRVAMSWRLAMGGIRSNSLGHGSNRNG
jgi:hypothetical protein